MKSEPNREDMKTSCKECKKTEFAPKYEIWVFSNNF